MSDPTTTPALPDSVRRALAAVRRRIRVYVWLEGLAIVVATLGIAFWAGLAIDWLFEPSPNARRVAIIVVGCIAGVVCYRYLLRRAFVRISDATAAVLLERRFPALADHVITAVDVVNAPDRSVTFHPELISRTNQAAGAAIAAVRPGELFNRRPLIRALSVAGALLASLVGFAILSSDVFGFWMQRLALSDQLWPRRVQLEVVGFPTGADGRRTHKLAQDDDFELLVHARADGYLVPDEVEIRFRLADGRRGRDTLTRVGVADTNREDFQLFRYQFKHVVGDMDFDVVGGDDRVRDLHLKVVDRPELASIELECVYPEYLQRQSRRLLVTGGMRIPEGTRFVLHANATKPLTAAQIRASKDKHETTLTFADAPQQKLDWEYGTLTADDVLLVNVTDSDGVSTREPYRVSISAVKDEVPQVAVRLAGISTAITPDAIIPFAGKVTDDYALDGVWFEYQVDGGKVQMRPFSKTLTGQTSFDSLDSFDTRALNASTGKRALELKSKQRLTLSIKAADRYNLDAQKAASTVPQKHAGSSQQFLLDVVTPADLLALLERRELALRQRFQAIYDKLSDTRNLLSRVGADEAAPGANDSAAAGAAKKKDAAKENKKGGASEADAAATGTSAERLLTRTRLRVSGSLQNVVQSADEVGGVADAFDDLNLELENNRIDNPDLKSRLGEQISRPLHRIAHERMPQLAAELKLVEEHLEDPAATGPQLKASIKLADQILVEMKQVLDKMLELETYNEVVTMLRDIITDQEQINRRTEERKKERIHSLFQD